MTSLDLLTVASGAQGTLEERYLEAVTLFWEKFKTPKLEKALRAEQFAKVMSPYHEGSVRKLKLATDFRFKVKVWTVWMPFGLASLFLRDSNAIGISCASCSLLKLSLV